MRHTSFPIDDNMLNRIDNLLTGTQTVSRFAAIATEEKVKRMEARNERARLQLYEKDIDALTPIVAEILKRLGK